MDRTSGNLTVSGNLANGGALTLGANANISGGINVKGPGSALYLAGNNLTAGTLELGYELSSPVTFDRGSGTPGTLTLNSLDLGNGQSVALISGDTITGGNSGAVNLYTGATLSTAATTNITSSVNVVASTLNLGADLSIGNQSVNVENGGVVNLAGHNLVASYLLLGLDGTSTVTLNRGSGTPGNLTLGNLFLGNGQNLTLLAGDTISNGSNGVNVTAGATLTTAATSNITLNDVNVSTGGIVNLGADLNLSVGNLNVRDTGSAFNAQGHAVTATNLYFGYNGSAPVTVSNLGAVTASELHVGNGTSVTLHGGDVINGQIDLENNSVLTVQQSSDGTGITLNGTSLSDLTIDPSSVDLIFTSITPGGWDFRWEDSSSGNWVSTLTTMVNDQQINPTLPPGQTYAIVDSGGYTYIESASVPEPSSLVLMGLGLLGAVRSQRGRRSFARSEK